MTELVLITGISGSGKSLAMHALEDAGYFCVDNLPPELLNDFLRLEDSRPNRRLAVALDVRSTGSPPALKRVLGELLERGMKFRTLFLEAGTEALVRRFSETRRPHPLGCHEDTGAESSSRRALIEAIEHERELMAGLRENATVLDTSELRPAQLRRWVLDLVRAPLGRLTLVFQSFAYKHGVPRDADFVFDVRVLPNPHYERELRPHSGKDPTVARYLQAQPEAMEMVAHITAFIERWLPSFEDDQRGYLTVAVGCTGGQHRSVYIAEALGRHFIEGKAVLVRHRELDV